MKGFIGHNARRASCDLVRSSARAAVELLENRAYLTGVVFGTPVNLPASTPGVAPHFDILADFNGDNHDDLVVANTSANTVSVLLGNGDGSFSTSAVTKNVGNPPLPLQVADVNNDGHNDIISGNANTVSVILGNGDGTFQAPRNFAALSDNHAIAIADFNHDGHLDIASVSLLGTFNNVAILLGDGSGNFGSALTTTDPHGTLAAVAAGDFNHDGNPDLAIADQTDNMVTTLIGIGDGTFHSGNDYPTASAPTSIVAADFNNDSKLDLVTSNSTGGTVSFLAGVNDTAGSFLSSVDSTITGTVSGGGGLKVRVANFNSGDTIPDLLVLLSSGSQGDAAVLLGNGDGTFRAGTVIATHGATRDAIAAGDLNHDGFTDAVVTDATQITALLNITSQDTVPPDATVDPVQATPVNGADHYDFTVTYTDNLQVDVSTLGNDDLIVVDPQGASHAATLVSTALVPGTSVTATYRLSAPNGTLTPADNGTYTVNSLAGGVKDSNNNALPAKTIGTFALSVPLPGTGLNLVGGDLLGKFPSAVVGGSRSKAPAFFKVTNSGTALAKAKIQLTLYVSLDRSLDGSDVAVKTITAPVNLRPGKSKVYRFAGFSYPSNLADGSYVLLAKVDSGNTVSETNETDNIGSSTRITIAAPFVEVQNLWTGSAPAALVVGKRVSLPLQLRNNGNVNAKGTATVTITASTDATADAGDTALASIPLKLNIAPGKTRTARLGFKVPTLAAGTYHLIISIAFPGDANASNDTIVSTNTFTVA